MHSRLWIAMAIASAAQFSLAHAGDKKDKDKDKPSGDLGGNPFKKADPDAADAKPETDGSSPVAPEPAVATPADKVVVIQAPKFTWEPYGYLRLQYRAVQNADVAFVGRDDGFELQNARIGVRGNLRDRAAFGIAFDGAVDERAQVNEPQGKLRVGLRDAWADVAVTGRAVVRAGFFQSWVDPEAMVPDTSREFVDKPIESRGVRATEGYQVAGLTPGRSLGAAFRVDRAPGTTSDEPRIGFEIAVQNGSDEFASNNDNDSPAISAALIARLPREGYFIAAARWNPRTTGQLPALMDETDVQGTAGLHVVGGPASIGLGVVVSHTTFPTTAGPSDNAFGAHAQLMFVVPASLPFEVGYRFGVLDPSSLLVTDRVMEHTVGAVLSVPELRMRLQLQLTHVVEQAERTLSNDRAQLAVEVSL